jgi:NAD(P)-dependent dehydrogenase (short-subunit alcohol dehydrogenase family)
MTKTIVITGGARGIGAATARVAAKRGWSVAFSYLSNDDAANATAAAVEAAGGKALAVRGDVGLESEVVALFDRAVEAFGPVDGVVNNAGIIARAMPFADMTAERIHRVVEVNVYGALLAVREGVRRMAKSRGGNGGAIVNLSSAAVKLGAANEFVDYAAAKGAMEPLTIGLSKELGPEGIRVNAVRPGLIETDIHAAGGSPDRARRLGVNVPLGRPGTADEVGAAIVWLLSDDASYVSGAVLDVTGGR